MKRSIMCSFVGPPALAPRWRRSWRANWRRLSRHVSPVIAKAGDLAALLTNLEERDAFIDEIHALVRRWKKFSPAMEDFQLIYIGEDPQRGQKIDLAKFILAARPRAGLLTNPLRDRLASGTTYTEEELEKIVTVVRAGIA